VPVPLDSLAANLDPGRKDVKGGQGHHDAHEFLALPPERLVQFGSIDAVQSDKLPGDDYGVAVDDLGGAGQRNGTPAERQEATRRPSIRHRTYQTYRSGSIGCLRLPLCVLENNLPA
jgi:hypothetical protein